jgi:hypothetical protein
VPSSSWSSRFTLEGESIAFPRKVENTSPNDTASYPRRPDPQDGTILEQWIWKRVGLLHSGLNSCHTSFVFQILCKEVIIVYAGRNLIIRNDRSITKCRRRVCSYTSSCYVSLQTLELFSRLSLTVLYVRARPLYVLRYFGP